MWSFEEGPRSGGAKHFLLRTASGEASAEQEMLRARIGMNSPKDLVLLHSKSSVGEGPRSKRSAIRAPLEKRLEKHFK